MMKYELTVILDDGVEKNTLALSELEKLVESVKGKVTQKDDWGLKRFAYPIKKKDSGHYYFFGLELEPKALSRLEEKLRLMDQVIRYLVVRAG